MPPGHVAVTPVRRDCPVCGGSDTRHFVHVDGRDYWRCESCLATYLDPRQRPTAAEELAQYQLHRNHPHDPGYRRFLNRLAEPLLQRLPVAQRGLDYGAGPGPALAAMLREAGHEVTPYDPFFAPHRAALEVRYQFITCTEAAEHFHDPAAEFSRFDALLEAGGWLGLMTGLLDDDTDFVTWHYRRDPTHVVFYQAATLQALADRLGWHCELPGPDVALMRKPAA
jgi:hypothetical protein